MHSKTKISGFCAIVLDDGLENNKNVFKNSVTFCQENVKMVLFWIES